MEVSVRRLLQIDETMWVPRQLDQGQCEFAFPLELMIYSFTLPIFRVYEGVLRFHCHKKPNGW